MSEAERTNPVRRSDVLAAVLETIALDPKASGNVAIAKMIWDRFHIVVTPNQVAGGLNREGIKRGTGRAIRRTKAEIAGGKPPQSVDDGVAALAAALRRSKAAMAEQKRLRASELAWKRLPELVWKPPPVVTEQVLEIKEEKAQAPSPQKEVVAPEPLLVNEPQATLNQFRSQRLCQWPTGGDRTGERIRFECEIPAQRGSYCREHAKYVYVRVRDRREDHRWIGPRFVGGLMVP